MSRPSETYKELYEQLLLTKEEYAFLSGLTADAVHWRIYSGKLPTKKVGNRRLIVIE